MIRIIIFTILLASVGLNLHAGDGDYSDKDTTYLVTEINKILSRDTVKGSSIKHSVPLIDDINLMLKGVELFYQVDYRVWTITFKTNSGKLGTIYLHKMWKNSDVDGAIAGYASDIEGFDRYRLNNSARLDLEPSIITFRFMATCAHSGWIEDCWNRWLNLDDLLIHQ